MSFENVAFTMRTLMDEEFIPWRKVDALYLVDQVPVGAALEAKPAARLFELHQKPVWICAESEEGSDSETAEVIRERLLSAGIPEKSLADVLGGRLLPEEYPDLPVSRRYNTQTEMAGLVRFAREQRVRTLALLSPTYHASRVLLTALGAIRDEGAQEELFVYVSLAGMPCGWNEPFESSQEKRGGTVGRVIGNECGKIFGGERYGNLPTISEAMEMLDLRDEFMRG